MREINTVEEIQDISYEILVKFHDFCENHGLRYILAGGTLLGAIRHHDFIPWDDDIDVQMPRPDYEKFLNLSKAGIADNTKVVSWKDMGKPYFSFAKVIDTRTILRENISVPNEIGVYIDVFPTDGLPSSVAEINKKFKRLMFYKKLLTIRILKIQKGKSSTSYLKKIALVPFTRIFFSPRVLIRKINSIATEQAFEHSEFVAFQVLGYNLKEVTVKDKFYKRILVKFREKDFYVPSNYDEYLKGLFDNYLELPPVNQRVPRHSFKAYWRDKV